MGPGFARDPWPQPEWPARSILDSFCPKAPGPRRRSLLVPSYPEKLFKKFNQTP